MPNHSKKCKCKCNKTPCRCSSEDLCAQMHQHLDNALQCMSQIDANETATENVPPSEEPSSTHDTTNRSDTPLSKTSHETLSKKVADLHQKLKKWAQTQKTKFIKKFQNTQGSLLSTSELQDQRHSNPYLLVADDAELQRATDSWSVSAPTADPDMTDRSIQTCQVTFSRMCTYTPPRAEKPVCWSARGLDDIQIDCQVTFICERKSLVDGLDELEVTITRSPRQEQRDELWHIMTIDEQQACLCNMKYTKTWSNVKVVIFSLIREGTSSLYSGYFIPLSM
jgi:hypothetical protein